MDIPMPFSFGSSSDATSYDWGCYDNTIEDTIGECENYENAASAEAEYFNNISGISNIYEIDLEYKWDWETDFSSSNCYSIDPNEEGHEYQCNFNAELVKKTYIDFDVVLSWSTIPFPEISIPDCLSAQDFSSWKNSWDVTVSGLFPNMTTDEFFNNVLEMDEDNFSEFCDFFNP
jgi:hypothetical protein